MSSGIQNKLLELSCDPPPGTWQKIASELDDAALFMQFPSRLKEFTATPPTYCWENIQTELEAAGKPAELSTRLIEMEVSPPAGTWQKILAYLELTGTKPGSSRRRVLHFTRYAAAAVFIGVLIFAGVRMLDTEVKKETTASVPVQLNNFQTDSPVTDSENTLEKGADSRPVVSPASDDDARNDEALEASKKTYARLDISPQKKAVLASQFSFSNFLEETGFGEHGASGLEEAVSVESFDHGRYIVLMTPDGHFIRMSKKLSDMVCCVSGEETDENCRSQIQKWRKQLACTDASHPGNFMDILNLVGSLSED
ncbi:MAG: hypothetical protein ACO25B_04390 [Chitinophagaceae bacterium]